jgi:hypothetical protein
MPLSSTRLGAAIKTKLLAIGCVEPATGQGVTLADMSNAIAAAVVEELHANATVMSLGLIAPPGTAGGPVTGTGTIT